MASISEQEAVVIGGGLVGASIAWGLTRAGVQTVVLDGEDLALRASRANFALIWVQGKGVGKPDYARWSQQAAQNWPQLASDLLATTGIDVSLSQKGGFSFALSDAELQQWHDEAARVAREVGEGAPDYQVLDHAATRAMLPAIGPDVVGSVYSTADGHVNSLRLLRALHTALLKSGVDYRSHHDVTQITPDKNGFILTGIWGQMRTRKLILAAGVNNTMLAPMVGLHVPLVRSKGQILVTEKCAPFFDYTAATIRQADEGGVMIGDSEETHSAALMTNQDISAVLANRAIRIFPHLADVNIVRSWAGFRVKSKDGMPIYQQSETCPGAFVVTCHSGVTLASNHTLIVAPQIAAGRLDDNLKPFSARRFHVSVTD
ncbi:NAD(P)/FAD-dependent oxidoreductase [Paenochrobactrum sp. BZR 588]|uniref:NAD(P)/FAD-dependent oxidoreductase n=1 Tax=unclassified Paenochrobactrum TaxID=2639760 RepID=UPI003852BFEF